MSAAIEAQLKLDIAQFQAELMESRNEARKWIDELKREGRRGGAALDPIAKAHERLAAYGKQAQAVNPWTTATRGAEQHVAKLREMLRWEEHVAAQHAKLASYKGPQAAATAAVNPWASGASQYAAMQAERDRVATRTAALDAWRGRSDEGFDTNRILWQQAQQSRSSSSRGRGGFGAGGGRGMNLGMMSMQFQDIAVQAQMGTRASIILAQQGSQLLSVFGAGGMIAGGVIAIGGAFYTMKEKSLEAFAAAKKEAAEFDQSMSDAAHGGIADMVGGLEKLSARSQTLRQEMQDAVGWMPAITEMIGGAKMGDKIELVAEEKRKNILHRRSLSKQLIESSGDDTRIAELRASGHDEEADALEREINLKRELYKISRMDVDGDAKEALAAAARAKAALAANPHNTKKDREDAAAIEAKLHDARLKALDPADRYLQLSKEQEAVLARMATEGGMFYDQSVAGLEAWAAAKKEMGDTTGLVKVLKLLEEAKDLEEQMAAAAKEATDNTIKRDNERDAEREKQNRISQARAVLDLETKIARETARTGSDDSKTVQVFRDELNTLQLQDQLQDQLKISQKEALALAREKVAAERAAADAIKAQASAEKARQQLRSRQELAAEMKVDALRAAGKDKEADALERRIRLVRETMQIQQQTGLDERQSAAIARQRLDDQEQAAERAARAAGLPSTGRRGRIRGVTREHGLSDHRGPLANVGPLSRHGPLTQHGGLAGFHDLQLGLAGTLPGRSGIGMGYMPDPSHHAPLTAQHAQNAARVDAATGNSQGGSVHAARVEQLLRELNENIKALND